MTELEEIIQKMINAGESEESIDMVVAEYESRPKLAKTEAVAMETADVTAVEGAVNEVIDTDLALEDGSSESQKVVANGGITNLYDDYIKRNKDEPANYNVDNATGQFIIDKLAGFTSGVAGLLGGAFDAVEMVADVNASVGMDIYDFFADEDFTAQEREEVSGIIESAFMVDDAFNIAATEIGKYKTIRDDEDGVGILGAFKEGNYLEAIDRTISGVFEAAPSVVAAFNPVGLALIGASSAGQHYEEKSEMEPESRGMIMMATSLAQGGIELGSELVTRGIFKGVGKMAALEGKALVNNVVGRLATAMFFEGTSEVASAEANNVIDKIYSEGKIDKFYDKDGNFDTNNVLTRVFDTYLISAALGGGIQGGVELTGQQKALQADRMMSPETQAQNKQLQEEITALELTNKNLDNTQASELIAVKKAQLRRKNNINLEIVESFNKEEKVEYLKILEQQLDLDAEAKNGDLTEPETKLNEDLKAKNDSKLNKMYDAKATEMVEARKANTLSFAESAESIGIKSTELSKDEYAARVAKGIEAEKAAVNKDDTLSPEQKSKAIESLDKLDTSRGSGAFYQDGQFFINTDMLSEIDQLNVGAHETLHPILNAIIGSSDQQGDLIEKFKKNLSKEQLDFVEADMNQRGYTEAEKNTEYLTVFSDAIANKEIAYDENLFTKIGDYLKPLFRAVGFKKLKMDNGKDVYNFMREYSKSAEKGGLSKDIKSFVLEKTKGKGVGSIDLTGKIQSSKSVVDLKQDLESLNDREFEFSEPAEFDAQVSNLNLKIKQAEKIEAKGESTSLKKTVTAKQTASSEKVQKLYEEKKEGYEAEIIKEFEPSINKIVQTRRNVPGFDEVKLKSALTTGPQGLLDLINKYNKDVNAETRGSKGEVVPIAAYINKYLRTRSIAIFDKNLDKTFTEGLDKAAKVAAEDTSSAPVKEGKLIKATKILSTEQLDRAKKIVLDSPIDPKKLSYKKLKGVTSEITSEITGIPAGKINNPAKNLSQGETTTAAMFISKNIDYIRKTLPEGAVLKAASEKLIGTATGVPKKLLDAFYVKSKRGDNLSPFILRKGLTNNEILEVIGRPRDGKPVPIDPRSPRGSVIKGIIDIVDRNITNELVRTEKDLTPQQQVDTGAGRGESVFSRAVLNNVNLLLTNQDFLATDNDFSLNAKNWKKIVKAAGGIPISMNTTEGRELFLNTAISSGLVSKTPESLWRNLQGTTKSIKNEAGKTIGRDYASSLPFLNVTEADAWIAKVKESGVEFAPETEVFKDMFNKVNPKAKKKPLEVLLKDPKFIKSQENSLQGLKDIFLALEDVMKDKKNMPMVVALLASTSGYQGAFIRRAAPWKAYQKGYKTNLITQEHTLPASLIAKYLFGEALNGRVEESFKNVEKNYFQVALLEVDDKKLKGTTKAGVKFNYTEKTPEGWTMDDSIWARYFNINVGNNNGGIGPDTMILANGNSVQQEFGVNEMGFKVSKEYINNKIEASESNNDQAPKIIQYSKNVSVQQSIDTLAKTDKALDIARDLDAPVKKIRVFDFDDTLARTKSKVGYIMPDGTTGKIDAETFAKDAGTMEAEGATWDFSEFSKVMNGRKGPLFEVAKIIADKRGTDDVFVLTARPADAAGPIKEFLGSLGLDIPLKNITGLGDGSPQAKASWVVGKAAEGYNDFYFADDATGNVKAVKEALSVLDVKSKVQQAKIKFSKTIDKEFNEIIENKTGIQAQKNYASVKAELVGRKKGKFNFFIPPSAEDFIGLLYKTLGKGKIGDAQLKWYKKHLLDPYARAMDSITIDRNTLARNFKALKKNLKIIPKDLKKKVKDSEFTKEQAVRVYIWNQLGNDVPGLSKADLKELVDMIKDDPQLELFAQEVIKINKGRKYAAPKEGWIAGTITTDLLESLNTTGRKKYLAQWQQNVDIIFSEKNLNKMEAAYGGKYRKAMENILKRMKTGRNRTSSPDALSARFTDWLTGSIGAIMFLNARSAVLQTISAINFINFGDNNVFAAAKALANTPQYRKDFMKLWNSDFLKERRGDLKINVNEADIADISKENGIRGFIGKLLKLGFKPTTIADSLAIVTGGATFYRNRTKALVRSGMDIKDAEAQAMLDFRETAEESQQSSRADKISSQQAGGLGRIILAFANTPAQYARIIKKAASDLKNGRGDTKANISKILYYGVAQNLLFTYLQQALFAISFEDEEEEQDTYIKAANSMIDGIARGTGIAGSIFSVVKNAAIRLHSETKKTNPKYEDVALELARISPPISSKIQKLRSAGRTASWNMDEMKEGFSLDNPAYLAGGNVVSAVTNIPLDRVVKKVDNIVASSNEELETYKRIFLLLGWSEWQLDIDKKKKKKKKKNTRRGKSKRKSRQGIL